MIVIVKGIDKLSLAGAIYQHRLIIFISRMIRIFIRRNKLQLPGSKKPFVIPISAKANFETYRASLAISKIIELGSKFIRPAFLVKKTGFFILRGKTESQQ